MENGLDATTDTKDMKGSMFPNPSKKEMVLGRLGINVKLKDAIIGI